VKEEVKRVARHSRDDRTDLARRSRERIDGKYYSQSREKRQGLGEAKKKAEGGGGQGASYGKRDRKWKIEGIIRIRQRTRLIHREESQKDGVEV
jgi:hypothetical protein